jgi:N utilization substance protein A
VEEAAFVEIAEIANIEGFDEETATEIQTRAREYLERREQELDAKRKKLGVEDQVLELDGMTLEMLVALGENEIKTMEDFAGCASDDLVGWHEKVDGESVRQPGFFDDFNVARPDAEAMIIAARVKAGWITEEDLQSDAEGEAEAEAEASGDGAEAPAAPEGAADKAEAKPAAPEATAEKAEATAAGAEEDKSADA